METAPLDTSFYKQALIVLGAAGVVIPIFHRLRVSPVLGFMLVGIVVGPFGLASLIPHLPWLSAITISTPASIEPIAHLGVVLLLFMIGLELSFERLWVMRRLDSSRENRRPEESNNLEASGGKQIDDLLNGVVGAVVGGFEFARWLVSAIWAMMEAAVGERSAQPFVEEEEEQRYLDSFWREAVGVAGAVAL